MLHNFNPRTPCGVRRSSPSTSGLSPNFNPRTPCGVRRTKAGYHARNWQFQSTHPLRGATGKYFDSWDSGKISIHAPLAGCDRYAARRPSRDTYFNPRTPCGVRRAGDRLLSGCQIFQSTHPLRGATLLALLLALCLLYFNPRTPCGVRLCDVVSVIGSAGISIHAPLAGCDALFYRVCGQLEHFNPRTPCGVRLLSPA